MEEKTYVTKETLIEKARELAEQATAFDVNTQIRNLKRQWNRLSDEDESFYDRELADQFDAYLDQIRAREAEVLSSVEDRKKDIISQAKQVLNQTNFKKATNEMNELMDQWKSAGRANAEVDDALWAEFKEVRDQFYANRKAYYANLSETYEANKAVKEEIIAKAKAANELTNFKEINNIMNDLMEEWKKSGTAGRDTDEKLWKEFSAERKTFFSNRNAYYENLRNTYAQRVEAKKEIIQEAKHCLARSEFTEEEIAAVKELRTKWKEVGNAGRDNEDALWKEFNSLVNTYFENLRLEREY